PRWSARRARPARRGASCRDRRERRCPRPSRPRATRPARGLRRSRASRRARRRPLRSPRQGLRPAPRAPPGRLRSTRYGRRAPALRDRFRSSRASTTILQCRTPFDNAVSMIQSVDRAARIIRAHAASPARLGVSELADRLGLAKTTVHGLLRTLHHHGLVEQHPDSDKYQLGPQLLQLSNRYLDLNELRARSLAWSELLATRAGEAVRVGVPHGNGVLVVHHVFRPDASLQILEVGALLPLHATALGKAVLAYADPGEVDAVARRGLPKLTGRTHTTAAALVRELAAVREHGYALEREEAVLGEGGVAAPIFDRSSESIGAIGVAGPRERVLKRGREAAVAGAVIEAARGISRDLGAPRWPA